MESAQHQAFARELADTAFEGSVELAHLLSSTAVHAIASKTKLSTLAVAHLVPGIGHNHGPVKTIVEDCEYCQLFGNCLVRDAE